MSIVKIRHKILTALLISLAATPCFAQADEKVQYQLNLQAGKSYYLQATIKQTTTTIMQGKEQTIEQTKIFGYNLDVEEVEPSGNVWINCKYESVKLEHKGPQQSVTYDSANKNKPVPLAAVTFAALVNEHFYIRVTLQGRLDKVNGIPTMRRYMASKIPQHPSKKQIVGNLKNQVNEQTITNLFEDFFAFYPNSPVSVGDTWIRTDDQKDAPGIYENSWTLKEKSNGKVIIENTSTIKPNPDTKVQINGAVQSVYHTSGKQTGRIVIDESTGLPESVQLDRNIVGQTEIITGAEKLQQPPTPVKMHTTLTFLLSETQQKQPGDFAK